MARHVNGTINFSIADKPRHKTKMNKVYEKEERIRIKKRVGEKITDIKEQKEQSRILLNSCRPTPNAEFE